MSKITKIQVNGTEYDLPEAPARVSLYIDVPQNPSFPITGTLTSSQHNEIMKTSAPVIAVQVATSQSDMVETYYCYCNYLTPHCGLYGSDFYGRYDDTTLLHIKIEQNQSYTISKVSAGSGSSGVSSFGGKTGAIALSDDFKMNGNTLALKKAITSITNFVDAYNDSFDFYEKTIKFTNANYSSSGEYYYYKIEFANGFSIYGYAGGGMSIQSNDPNAAGEMYDRTIYDTASGGSLPATLELSGVAYGDSYIVSGFYGKTTDSGASYVQLTPEQFAAWIMIEFDDLKGGSGTTYSVVEITSSTSTLTDEQYNTLTASPFNKIKLNNTIYDLHQETSTQLVYTANYFNNGDQITIKKDTKAVTTGSLSSLISISAFVKNDLNYNQSNTRFALSAYQGKVLNDRLTALESGGSATLYQHTITYSSDKFSDTDQFSGEGITGSFSISFYSTHGHFESPSDFWAWLIGRGSINVCDGQLWGNMGGGTSFTRITVFGNTDAEKYITFEAYGGYGEWNSIQYFLKNPDATGLTDTIIDGVRNM